MRANKNGLSGRGEKLFCKFETAQSFLSEPVHEALHCNTDTALILRPRTGYFKCFDVTLQKTLTKKKRRQIPHCSTAGDGHKTGLRADTVTTAGQRSCMPCAPRRPHHMCCSLLLQATPNRDKQCLRSCPHLEHCVWSNKTRHSRENQALLPSNTSPTIAASLSQKVLSNSTFNSAMG